MVARILLSFVLFCVFANTVRASLCEIQDRASPAQEHVQTPANSDTHDSLSAPSTPEDNCAFCVGCARCGGCCVLVVAPGPAHLFAMSAQEPAAVEELIRASVAEQLPSELLRPPTSV